MTFTALKSAYHTHESLISLAYVLHRYYQEFNFIKIYNRDEVETYHIPSLLYERNMKLSVMEFLQTYHIYDGFVRIVEFNTAEIVYDPSCFQMELPASYFDRIIIDVYYDFSDNVIVLTL